MIEITIDWIKNKARIENTDKNTYGVISINGMKFTEEDDLKSQIMQMYDNDEINMRDMESSME